MKSMHKNWNITVLFIIHEDFDSVWAEHYPVTLIQLGGDFLRELNLGRNAHYASEQTIRALLQCLISVIEK